MITNYCFLFRFTAPLLSPFGDVLVNTGEILTGPDIDKLAETWGFDTIPVELAD